MSNCIFCKIVKGEIPAKIIEKDPDWVAFYDIHPQAKTHVLIIPTVHIESVNDVHDSDGELLGKLMLATKKIAKKLNVDKSGFKLVVNNGKGAGQVVFHLHIHLLSGLGEKPGWKV